MKWLGLPFALPGVQIQSVDLSSERAFSLKYTCSDGEEERERTFLEAPFCYIRVWCSEGHVR
jgi:hypothetical protein